MNKEVTIKAADNTGNFSAYISMPENKTSSPAVIVIQEIFGVNRVMRDICDNLAAEGYLAICPDLFWRQEPNVQLTDKTEAEWAKAFQFYQGFNLDKGIEDLKTTLDFTRQYPFCSGKVGTMGYCLGGRLAYLMACRSNADCNISYYGVAIESMLDEAKNIQKPLLMHIAEKDKYVPPAAQQQIIDTLSPNKKVTLHNYAGLDHAFSRIGGEHYNAAGAKLAHERTMAFLKACL